MEDGKVGFLKSCINCINALSGIGMLSIPYALSSGGWLSLILLLVIAGTDCFISFLIRRCMDKNPNITSYPDIATQAFGKKGRVIASFFTYLELYVIAIGLLILEGDNLHKLLPNYKMKLGSLIVDGRNSFVVFAAAAILPSMWVSDLGVMSFFSAGGVLSSLVVVVCVLCVGLSKGAGTGFHGSSRRGELINFHGIPTAIGLYTFCFGAHAVFPTIYKSMRKKRHFSLVILISFVASTSVYFSMAVLGYLMYGKDVQSQVTLNLPTDKVSSKIAIYTILAVPVFKYALLITPIAAAIETQLPLIYQNCKAVGVVIRIGLLVSTAVFAIIFPSFQSVASLTGAVFVMVVSFLLPCLSYLKIFEVYRKWGVELVAIVLIMVTAVSVGVMGTYSSIVQAINDSKVQKAKLNDHSKKVEVTASQLAALQAEENFIKSSREHDKKLMSYCS